MRALAHSSAFSEGVRGLVDGEHFFDFFADDVVWEYPYSVPGAPTELRGREALMKGLQGSGEIFELDRITDLIMHPTDIGIILEYSSHARSIGTGRPYHNRFVSILYIKDRKIHRWREYYNPLVILAALKPSAERQIERI